MWDWSNVRVSSRLYHQTIEQTVRFIYTSLTDDTLSVYIQWGVWLILLLFFFFFWVDKEFAICVVHNYVQMFLIFVPERKKKNTTKSSNYRFEPVLLQCYTWAWDIWTKTKQKSEILVHRDIHIKLLKALTLQLPLFNVWIKSEAPYFEANSMSETKHITHSSSWRTILSQLDWLMYINVIAIIIIIITVISIDVYTVTFFILFFYNFCTGTKRKMNEWKSVSTELSSLWT